MGGWPGPGLTGLALLRRELWFGRAASRAPKWLRRLGLAAFIAVVLQGVLGGLRVVLFKDAIGIFHATLAQLFFVLICAIALFTSRWWQSPMPASTSRSSARNRKSSSSALAAAGTTVLILGQLILGAAMRHQHAGLAIPDFPLAYGKLWPAMDADSVARYNQQRMEVAGRQPHHRLSDRPANDPSAARAVRFSARSPSAAWSTRRALGGKNLLSRLALAWLGLILTQVLLGAATIWSNKAADIATAHVLVGALSLALGAILCIISSQRTGVCPQGH